MALLHGGTSFRVLPTGTARLGLTVAAWWALIIGGIAFTVPTPVLPARTSSPSIVEGAVAVIHAPPLEAWPIPIDRTTFDDYHRAFLDDDEGGLIEALSRPGWVRVADRQLVRVTEVRGDAARVELLEGPDAGGQGWLKLRQLRPAPSAPDPLATPSTVGSARPRHA